MSPAAKLAAVANHPNRSSRTQTTQESPTPARIREARAEAGLTQEQAAELVYATWHTWWKWEQDPSDMNHRRMHPSAWELFTVKVKILKLLEQEKLTPADVRRLGITLPEAG
jgi:DNA-binding XRE family transcriptional regulator